MIRDSLNLAIDCGSPLNRAHRFVDSLYGLWTPIPGLAGGRWLHNLAAGSDVGGHAAFPAASLPSWTGAPNTPWSTQAVRFGTNSLSIGTPPSTVISKPLTFQFWIFPTAAATGYLFDCALSTTIPFRISYLSAGTGQFQVRQGISTYITATTTTMALNQWSCFGISRRQQMGQYYTDLYVNGRQDTVGAASGLAAAGTQTSTIGSLTTGGSPFQGSIGLVGLWIGRAFGADEMAEFYRLSLAGFPGLLRRLAMPIITPASSTVHPWWTYTRPMMGALGGY